MDQVIPQFQRLTAVYNHKTYRTTVYIYSTQQYITLTLLQKSAKNIFDLHRQITELQTNTNTLNEFDEMTKRRNQNMNESRRSESKYFETVFNAD